MSEQYIGDGLYASFDGYQVKLRAPRHGGDHEVYLEPSTYQALVDYVADIKRRSKARESEPAEPLDPMRGVEFPFADNH